MRVKTRLLMMFIVDIALILQLLMDGCVIQTLVYSGQGCPPGFTDCWLQVEPGASAPPVICSVADNPNVVKNCLRWVPQEASTYLSQIATAASLLSLIVGGSMMLLSDFLADLSAPKNWTTGILVVARVSYVVIGALYTRGILTSALAALAPFILSVNLENLVFIFRDAKEKLANRKGKK